ncbi:MAG: hypothetical protein IPM42_18370 [Saprospiraceae bacterium]|nr:hypothetical protein [Saprospiraceae bacterium]
MKSHHFVFLFMFLLTFINCQKNTTSNPGNNVILLENDCFPDRKTQQSVEDRTGKVILIGDTFLIENQKENIRYAPCNLPDNLKTEQLTLLFSADLKEIYPNERWMGEPTVLTKVKILKSE